MYERGEASEPGTPDEWASYLTQAVPGADTAVILDVLSAEKLSHEGRIDALKALERHVAWIHAMQAQLLAALHDDAEAALPEGAWNKDVAGQWNFAAEEVACALKVSGATAEDRLHVARELDGRLPTTLGMLETGEISWMQAKAVVEVTDVLDPEVAAGVEADVAPKMPSLACGQTRRALHRAVARLDPEGVEVRHQHRKREREITHREVGDGMAHWGAYLPAEQAARLDQAVDAHAETLLKEKGRGCEDWTLAQRRVDALVDLVLNGSVPRTGSSGRTAAVVQVTVPLDALLGIEQEPGQLKGYGPITASQARRIAFTEDSVWRRLLTDPVSGMVVKTDPVTYKPTAETARHVVARDGVCMFPSCRMPAHRCDLDHVEPFDNEDPRKGGETTPENVIPLCRRHHLLKHRAGWGVEREEATGTVTWTAPTGHHYTSHPHDYRE
ncbi:DUF222 domain-containing protein [Streptomyces ovatisporus]|uniref:DUF222 domain-containing protein n=1 Tax=Streptomyces ovatisporus TaxID=1128682 RepID=A0ABV9A7S1_9ACTN